METTNFKIYTHNGRAHADEVIASSVFLFKKSLQYGKENVSIHRTPEISFLRESKDENFVAVDIGQEYDNNNFFDHHQTYDPICSITLVLCHFYNNETIYRALGWMKQQEIYDSKGPVTAAEYLGVKEDIWSKVQMPFETLFISLFQDQKEIVYGSVLHEMLYLLGQNICEKIENYDGLMNDIKESAVFFEFQGIKVVDVRNCKNFKLPLIDYCKENKKSFDVILSRSERNKEEYNMVRNNSCTNKVDFNKILNKPGVSFVHKTGFITSFSKNASWEELLSCSILKKEGI